ncbi:MAG: hypothetical protein JWN17_3093 [Frankiales bacterium]|nr:hypothetical protein [Frankiales bacterium]
MRLALLTALVVGSDAQAAPPQPTDRPPHVPCGPAARPLPDVVPAEVGPQEREAAPARGTHVRPLPFLAGRSGRAGQPARRRPLRRRSRAALALTGLLALSACSTSDLQFHNDDRLSFSAPKARALVTTPLRVTWAMQDFSPVGLDGTSSEDKGIFAVFVDRAPMPVGKDLHWLARNDSACSRDPRCPDPTYLADQDVYLTTAPRVSLDRLPDAGDGVGDEQHFVNVVLLNGKGVRIGESAWYRPFKTKRSAT